MHEYAYRIYRHTYDKTISGCFIAALRCDLDQLWTCVSSSQHHHRIKEGGVERICALHIFHKCKSLRIPSDRSPHSAVRKHCLPNQFPLWQHLVELGSMVITFDTGRPGLTHVSRPLMFRLRPPASLHCPIMQKMLERQTSWAHHKSQSHHIFNNFVFISRRT